MRLYIRDGKTVCRSWVITKVIKQNKKNNQTLKKKKRNRNKTDKINLILSARTLQLSIAAWISRRSTSPPTCAGLRWLSVRLACGSREFDSGRTNTQGLKITKEKVLPL